MEKWVIAIIIREVENIITYEKESRQKKRFKDMGYKMMDDTGLVGMAKYATERSENKYVIGREG